MASVRDVYPPQIWANESLRVLRDQLLMARLVHRDFENAIASVGDLVQTRKPNKLSARVWAGQTGSDADTQIEVDNLTARNLSITLDTLVYTAFLAEDETETTSIKSLQNEFLLPATDPISQKVDDDVMSEITSAASTDVAGNAVSAIAYDNPVGSGADMNEDDVIQARRDLNTNQCPMSGRVLVLSTDHEMDLLRSNLFTQADQSGSTEALTSGNLGRKFGFDIFMSQNVPNAADTDGTSQSIAFHRNCCALVMRRLKAVDPRHGALSASESLDDIGMRVTHAYDIRYKGVTTSIDVLYGVQLLDALLAVIINP